MARFIEQRLVHGEGDVLGDPVRLGLPWWWILQRIYQFHPATGQLAHDRVLILMGKGNAKTERIGEVGDAELCGPIAPMRAPRVILSAASYGQSIELFGAAHLGITGDPKHGRPGPLADRFIEGEHILEDRILLPDGVGRLERTTTVGGTNDGAKPTAHLFDELHEYQTERARRLFIVGNKSLGKRQVIRHTPPELGLPSGVSLWGPLLIGISTFGADRDSLLGLLYEHGVNVARGHDDEGTPVSDPGFLFLCWESDPAWDLEDSEQRRQAILEGNPMIGYSLAFESVERKFHDPTVPRSEFVRYNAARWPEAETRWLPAAIWDAEAEVVLDPALPVHAVVRFAPDHRAGAVAVAQRQGDAIALRVSHFPESSLPLSEYLDVATVEQHLAGLQATHPAPVLVPRRTRPGGPEVIRPTPGPEIIYSGGFFEAAAQKLRAAGAAVIDIPDSPVRRRAAGDEFKALAEQGRLVHESDPVLARELGHIVERPSQTGSYLEARVGKVICGAIAAMGAVHRAVKAEYPSSSRKLVTF